MLYLLALPILSPLLERCLPGVWGLCPYRELSHKPCPLCGATRAVGAVLTGDFRSAVALHPLSLLAVLFILCEMIFRAALLLLRTSRRSRLLLVQIDICAHTLLAVILICYIAEFMCGYI